jgi:CheY-like chemotaxis protein
MDVQLAAMSGIDLLRRLRAAGCGVPVIIISGNRTDTVREDAEEAGCAAFLWKPFSAETILSLLGSIARDDRTWSKGHVDECSVETAAQAVYSLRQSPDVTEEQV